MKFDKRDIAMLLIMIMYAISIVCMVIHNVPLNG